MAAAMGFRVYKGRFRDTGFWFGVSGLGFRVSGLGFGGKPQPYTLKLNPYSCRALEATVSPWP